MTTTRAPLAATALPVCSAYLAQYDPQIAHGLLQAVVDELCRVAALEHGKDPFHRRPQFAALPDGPLFSSEVDGGLVVVDDAAVAGDFRSQVVYQIAHESVHAACTAGHASHPVDEMFAVRFALRVMDALNPDYAIEERYKLAAAASAISSAEFLGFRSEEFGDFQRADLYGRAMLLGDALERELGWQTLVRLVHPGEPPREPDFSAWVATLSAPEQHAVAAIIDAS